MGILEVNRWCHKMKSASLLKYTPTRRTFMSPKMIFTASEGEGRASTVKSAAKVKTSELAYPDCSSHPVKTATFNSQIKVIEGI